MTPQPGRAFAHSLPGEPVDRWEPLEHHVREVARLAGEFAEPFGSSDWARLAGLWHDLGKYREAFQRYILKSGTRDPDASQEQAKGRVDHSTAGAIHAQKRLGEKGKVLAYVIAGHHAGLPDGLGGPASLQARLEGEQVMSDLLLGEIPPDIREAPLPSGGPPTRKPEDAHFWIRFLYSALVDADFLATEAFLDPGRSVERSAYPALPELLQRFDRAVHHRFGASHSALAGTRNRIRTACVAGAALAPGLFSLTVPTGGGKTIASLAFALHHARLHGLRRVIYAIPYTSIVEQTAEVFRDLLGDCVVEHHSNLDADDPRRENTRSRLAAENWDAPLVVTTNVQLFESLFAARSSRCRKLHNLAGSIVILDEAQLLPPEYLDPIRRAITELSAHYRTTFVFSTATQPALGLDGLRELAPDPEALSKELRRVRIEWPSSEQPTSWATLADSLSQERQVLCIVNRRDDARDLASALPPETTHLSALMCGEHRSQVLARIRRHLRSGDELRVVSTQLVEAGVDLDFPVVYRAFAGLDSIAQAAGRCNREGRLAPDLGRVVVFHPPKPAPPGLLRKGENAARELLFGSNPPHLENSHFRRYFELLYHVQASTLDKHQILDRLKTDAPRLDYPFRSIATDFRLVDESGYRRVLCTWGRGRDVALALAGK